MKGEITWQVSPMGSESTTSSGRPNAELTAASASAAGAAAPSCCSAAWGPCGGLGLSLLSVRVHVERVGVGEREGVGGGGVVMVHGEVGGR